MITAIIDWWYRQDYNVNSKHLSLFRIFFCLYTILFLGIPNYLWLGTNDSIPFFPPELSLGILFSDFPPSFFFVIITVLIYLLFGLLLFGLFTKPSSILLSILILIGNTFKYSFGKIDHDIFFVLLPLLLCNSGWGNHFSLDAIRNTRIGKSRKFSTRYIALFFGYAMFIAGVSKYLGGWLDLDSQAVYYHTFRYGSFTNPTPIASSLAITSFNTNWSEVLDHLIVFFEIGFLFAVVNPRVFRFFISMALLFHLANFLTLGIGFLGNIPLYLLFLNWKTTFTANKINQLTPSIKRLINYRNLIIIVLLLISQLSVVYFMNISPLQMQPSSLEILMAFSGRANHYKLIALPILLIMVLLSPKLYLKQSKK